MASFTAGQRQSLAQSGDAMADGSYPIRNRSDLENAIRAVGRASGGETGRRAVRRFIIKRAKTLGLSELVPSSWSPDGSLQNG